jgi:hypothetical protein
MRDRTWVRRGDNAATRSKRWGARDGVKPKKLATLSQGLGAFACSLVEPGFACCDASSFVANFLPSICRTHRAGR